MNPKLLLKAERLPVVEALDGSWRVGGNSDVYTVYFSRLEKKMACSCKAGATQKVCSHMVAVRLHLERNAANAAERETK